MSPEAPLLPFSPSAAPVANRLRVASSPIPSRAAFAAAMGKTFGGNRNVPEALGYQTVLGPDDFWNRYERNSVAARVVEAFPMGTWRGIGELIEVEDPQKITEFEKIWAEMSKRLKIWPKLRQADILAGLGRYGVLLIGAPGAWSEPLKKTLHPPNIKFLRAYSERDISIKTVNLDRTDERFGMPLMYELTRALPTELKKTFDAKVDIHWSRVIHIADGALDNEVYGFPRLERVWNRLDDLEKVVGAGAEAFWMRAHQGYHFNLDPDLQLDPDGEEELEEEAAAFEHQISRIVRTRGVDVKALGSDVAVFDKNVESILGLIAAGTGIPQRILSGSERGQLASQQDRVNWAERVQDRRMEFAGPVILNQLVDRFIAHGILPEPAQYEVRWPQVFDLSDDERAIIAGRWAEINQKNKRTTVKVNEIRDRILGLPALTDDEMKKEDERMVKMETKNANPEPPVNAPANPEKSGERR